MLYSNLFQVTLLIQIPNPSKLMVVFRVRLVCGSVLLVIRTGLCTVNGKCQGSDAVTDSGDVLFNPNKLNFYVYIHQFSKLQNQQLYFLKQLNEPKITNGYKLLSFFNGSLNRNCNVSSSFRNYEISIRTW